LDGQNVSLGDISKAFENNCTLAAHISTFRQEGSDKSTPLPKTHKALATKLVSRLNIFVAEQTLEDLLQDGATLDVDVGIVKGCLSQEAESVAREKIGVHFYIPQTDSMLDASVETGVEVKFHDQFSLLFSSLVEEHNQHNLWMMSEGDFLATDTQNLGWCYIKIPKDVRFISICVYHSCGKNDAVCIALQMKEMVESKCHCVITKY
jgi:hypothetical protein